MTDDLYDVARRVTDEVMGEGTYADINGGNPDPRVQAAIERGRSAGNDVTATEVVWGVRFPESKGGGEYDQQSEDFARRRVAEFPWLALIRRERTTRTITTETPWETVIPPGEQHD